MKRSNVKMNKNPLLRVKSVSAMALMALALSAGMPLIAAEKINLWHISDSKPLLRLEEKTEKADAFKWVFANDAKDRDYKKFVTSFEKEPVKFMEGIKAAWEEAKKSNKVDEFKSATLEGFDVVDSKDFGGKVRKDTFMEMIKSMLDKKVDDENLISDLFNSLSPAQLLLVDATKQEPKKEEPKKDEPKVSPVPDVAPPTLDSSVKEKPAPTGEQGSDAIDRLIAKQVCDMQDAERRRSQEIAAAQQAEIQKLADTLNGVLNKKSEESNVNPALLANKKAEKGLDELLPGLLANALNQDKKQDEVAAAPTNNNPIIPSNNRRDERNTDPNSFAQPLPEPQQPIGASPLFFPPSFGAGITSNVRLDLPTETGRQELADTQRVVSENKMRRSQLPNLKSMAQMGLVNPQLLQMNANSALTSIRTDAQKTQLAIASARNRVTSLDAQLEELKEGGRAALDPQTKKDQAKLQQEVDTSKRNIESQKQMAMMIQDPAQREQFMSNIFTLQNDVAQKEARLAEFNALVDSKIEEGNRQIKVMAKTRDQLNSEITKLESDSAALKQEEGEIEGIVNTANAQIMQQLQYGNGVRGGVQNVNNGATLQNFGGNLGVPRTSAPSRLGTALGGNGLTTERGRLGR